MSNQTTPIILVPGMGANENVFAAQLKAIPNLTIVKWIAPNGSDTISSYAKRLALKYNPDRPCIIGGASFGGIIAQEMANYLPALACVLIGSIKSRNGTPWWFKLARPLRASINLAPLSLLQASAAFSSEVPTIKGYKDTATILNQFSDSDRKLLRWSMKQVLQWKGRFQSIKTYQIHGEYDPIFPVSKTKADRIVKDGGHVISVSHPNEVTDFLRMVIKKAN